MITSVDYSLIAGPVRNFRKRMNEGELVKLRDSILTHGLLHNLVVTPELDAAGEATGMFRVVAGERRWRAIGMGIAALEEGGLDFTPAVSLAELSAVSVRVLEGEAAESAEEVQLVENLLREAVDELAVAEGFAFMVDERHYSAARLAERIGMSVDYVRERLRLLKAPQSIQRALQSGKVGVKIAELVTRIPNEADREAVAKRILEPQFAEILTVNSVTDLIRRDYVQTLNHAPFPVDNADLPGGACEVCPHKAANQPELAEEASAAGTAAKAGAPVRGWIHPNTCLNPSCFREKQAAWRRIELRQAEDNDVKVLPATTAAKIWGGIDHSMVYDSKYVDLAARLTVKETGHHNNASAPTWGEVLEGVEVPVCQAQHPATGQTHYLVERELAMEAAERAAAERGEPSPFAKSAAAARKNRLAEATANREAAEALRLAQREALERVSLVTWEANGLSREACQALILTILGTSSGALGMMAAWLDVSAERLVELVHKLETARDAQAWLAVAILADPVRVDGAADCEALASYLDAFRDGEAVTINEGGYDQIGQRWLTAAGE